MTKIKDLIKAFQALDPEMDAAGRFMSDTDLRGMSAVIVQSKRAGIFMPALEKIARGVDCPDAVALEALKKAADIK